MIDCLLLKLSQTCPAVKQSWFTNSNYGASLILPQPTTSDGDDCSLEINKTTNLPDNIPSWGAVAVTVGALFIRPPESMLETFMGSVCENVLMPKSACLPKQRKKHFIIWKQTINQCFMIGSLTIQYTLTGSQQVLMCFLYVL